MTSDNAHQRYLLAIGTASDNTKPAATTPARGEAVGAPAAYGVVFHFCPALGEPPVCGRVPASALLRHAALPAADVPADLRCRTIGCRTAYAALEHHGAAERPR